MSPPRAATAAGRRTAGSRTAKEAGPRGSAAAKPRRRKPAPSPARKPKPAASKARKSQAGTARTRKPKRSASAARGPRTGARNAAKPARARARSSAQRPGRAAGGTGARRKRIGWRGKLAVLAVILLAGAAGFQFWFRDSSLVAVTDVEVVGIGPEQRGEIVDALDAAASSMSTLDVDEAELRRVARSFATVESLEADANFPHGLRIELTERRPALAARFGEEAVAVAGDGTVLPGVEVPNGLPAISLEAAPEGERLAGEELAQARVVGAAPAEIAPLIDHVAVARPGGVEVELRGGIPVRFGDASRPEAKWDAALAVLADPKLQQLSYLDVRLPRRPAAGAAAPSA